MSNKKRQTSEILFNLVIVILAVTGIILMLTSEAEEGALQSSGLENFQFYTVLSTVFCGIVALIYLICFFAKKGTGKMAALKLAAVCGVAITFAVVAFMFGPLYGFPNFYQRCNLFFHLLLPVTAMAEFIFVKRKKTSFGYTVFAAIPTLLYAIGYLLNILINGIGGPWPDTNDFYGFLNWGWPVGICIFTGIPLTAFAVACLFRLISNKRGE